ncbi:MAG: hypothetical protein DI624_04120 [Brevundimonas sp.]|uniref:hypothetical protein n=1 Tax=Brevundimonas sp. TaxID=1871086 RepID=UPI000DB8B2F3|nr:hypothetical protein [Brevundimonas sp.]PZT99866.1 MAG: hypothetical protein DI624_04120 [Brevundimonas sp.]
MTVHSFEEARRQREEAVFDAPAPLKKGDGGGTSKSMPDLTSRMQRIEVAWVSGMAFVLVAFASGFLFIAAKMDSSFARMDDKLDALGSQVSEVRSDVAVLKERTGPNRP